MNPATIAPYQAAAASIYEPLKAADTTALQTTDATTKNSLESEKAQVGTDYQSAIDTLTQSVQDNSGKISQLYASRLGGNISGLQGNDMGNMFARANQQQGIIEQTRANKLAEITTGETNADITMNSGIAALTPKYQSLETQYALSAEAADEKAAQTQANSDRSYELSAARLGIEAQNTSNSTTDKTASQYKVAGKTVNSIGPTGTAVKNTSTSNGYNFTGPNGKPVNMSEFIQGSQMGGQDIVDLLQNGSKYDQGIAKKVQAADPQSDDQLISLLKKYDTGNYYGFK